MTPTQTSCTIFLGGNPSNFTIDFSIKFDSPKNWVPFNAIALGIPGSVSVGPSVGRFFNDPNSQAEESQKTH